MNSSKNYGKTIYGQTDRRATLGTSMGVGLSKPTEQQQITNKLRQKIHALERNRQLTTRPDYFRRFTFGKYMNTPISIVPNSYLDWIIENLPNTNPWVNYCEEEIIRRKKIDESYRRENPHI